MKLSVKQETDPRSSKAMTFYLRIGNKIYIIFLLHWNPLLGIRSTKVLHALVLEFFLNTGFSNNIDFFIDGELCDTLNVDCRGVGGAEYLVNFSGDPKTIKLLLVGAPRFCRVISNEDNLLACFIC